MKKFFLFFFCQLFALAAMVMSAQGVEKITICHFPPDNPENPQTIAVKASSLPSHLEHGDKIGECTMCTSNGGSCSSGADCCSGNCSGDMCVPACTSNGESCSSGAECCGGTCSAEGICASACTAGPETGGTPCSFDLPCCPKIEEDGSVITVIPVVCIYGACYAGETCALSGQECSDIGADGKPMCCFDNSCINVDPVTMVGTCSETPQCAADGRVCASDSDCCNNHCSTEGICYTVCALGGEAGDACSVSTDTPKPCCAGVCVDGNCHPSDSCILPEVTCTAGSEECSHYTCTTGSELCCGDDHSCVDGVCVYRP